jgi:hypothetical protein
MWYSWLPICTAGKSFSGIPAGISNNLTYSFNNKYFDFNAVFIDTDRVINQYYVQDDVLGGYALTYENGKVVRSMGCS